MRDDVQLKLDRARYHMQDLKSVIQDFKDSEPYAVRHKVDPETGENVVYLDTAQPVPTSIALIVGDVVQNLRGALDYAAWQLVLAAGNSPTASTAFPIAEHPPSNTQQVRQYEAQVRGMAGEVKGLIREMNPYRRTNNSLWRLHKLNNINKHRSLLTVCCNNRGISGWGDVLDNIRPSLEPLEKGSEVARFPPESQVQGNVLFFFDLALSEAEADTYMWPIDAAVEVFFETVRQTMAQLDGYREIRQ